MNETRFNVSSNDGRVSLAYCETFVLQTQKKPPNPSWYGGERSGGGGGGVATFCARVVYDLCNAPHSYQGSIYLYFITFIELKKNVMDIHLKLKNNISLTYLAY